MNAIERNLVYNSLSRILMENEGDKNVLNNRAVEYGLSDACNLCCILLGRDLTVMYKESAEYEPKTRAGYENELAQLVEFIQRCTDGKDPVLSSYDVLVMHMIARSCKVMCDEDAEGDGDEGANGDVVGDDDYDWEDDEDDEANG